MPNDPAELVKRLRRALATKPRTVAEVDALLDEAADYIERAALPGPTQTCRQCKSPMEPMSPLWQCTGCGSLESLDCAPSPCQQLERERDELQATLERVNNAKRLAQQRAEEVEARWKSLKKFVKSNAPQVNDATEETWGFAKAISKILSKMRELSIAAPPVETPDAARPQRSDEP